MRLFGGRRREPCDDDPGHEDAIEFAWRAHNAQEGWTAKVDTKAAILLALEGGSLFAVLSANNQTGALRSLAGAPFVLEVVGVMLILLSVFASAAAIFPMLGRTSQHKRVYMKNTIYFGHVRHWHPDDLYRSLMASGSTDALATLSRQLVEMSKRNWAKHRLVQVSLVLSVLGVTLVALSIGLNTIM